MAEGRFRFPKTIEEEELFVERAVPKSTRYKNKWAVGIFEDWQGVRSVKFPIVEVGGVFKEYELHKVQPLTRPTTEITGRIDAQLLVIQICSRGGKVFQRSIPSENVVPDSGKIFLSSFSKVFEKLIYNQLYNFLEKYSILYKYQFGLRKGYSTEEAILEPTDSLKKAMDKKLVTFGLFLDFSKAFDTINHDILLSKLYRYGIRRNPLRWFENYL